MLKELKVADVKCVDDSSKARGITICCGPHTYVSLIFDNSVPHEQTDELVRTLWSKMKLTEVIVQIP